jgi:hypothetical protein
VIMSAVDMRTPEADPNAPSGRFPGAPAADIPCQTAAAVKTRLKGGIRCQLVT